MTVEREVTKKEAWIWAIRPKTLALALVSVLVGSSLGFAKGGNFSSLHFISMLLASLSLQAASNLANDAADGERKADTKARVGFPRATQMGWLTAKEVTRGALFALFLSFLFALPLFLLNPALLFLFALSAAAAWFYSKGPYPLSYYGLGELFVILFFGFAITGISDYVQSGSFDFATAIASLQVGGIPTAVLAINYLRDIEQDRKAKRGTLTVKYGAHFGKMEITAFMLLPFLLSPLWVTLGFSFAAYLPLALLPLTLLLIQKIWASDPGPILNRYFGLAALIDLLFGLLLSLSFLL